MILSDLCVMLVPFLCLKPGDRSLITPAMFDLNVTGSHSGVVEINRTDVSYIQNFIGLLNLSSIYIDA